MSKTITSEVHIEVDLDEWNSCELALELKARKYQFWDSIDQIPRDQYFVITNDDDQKFAEDIKQIIWELNTERVKVILNAIQSSYHYPNLKEGTQCDQ